MCCVGRYRCFCLTPADIFPTKRSLLDDVDSRTDLGTKLFTADAGCYMVLRGEKSPVALSAFQNGFALEHPSLGLLVLYGNSAGKDTPQPANVRGQLTKIQCVPTELTGADRQYLLLGTDIDHAHVAQSGYITTMISSEVAGQLLRNVASVWQQNQSTPVETVQTLDDVDVFMKDMLTGPSPIVGLDIDDITSSISSIVPDADLVPNLGKLIKYTQIVDSYAYMADGNVPTTEVESLLAAQDGVTAAREEQTTAPTDTIPITIITGVPGSGKLRVCASITALAKENTRWHTLRPDVQTPAYFDAVHLQDQLSKLLAGHKRRKSQSDDERQLRVLVITKGCADLVHVVKAITFHPDEQVASQFRIAAVCCCVDPANAYIQSRTTFPMFLEMCAKGWCSTMIITGERKSGYERPSSSSSSSSASASASASGRFRVTGTSGELERALSLAEWVARQSNPYDPFVPNISPCLPTLPFI